MNKHIVGLKPWLPHILASSPWWTEPIRAERLAALRIGIGLTLLVDVLWLYLPRAGDFFGAAIAHCLEGRGLSSRDVMLATRRLGRET